MMLRIVLPMLIAAGSFPDMNGTWSNGFGEFSLTHTVKEGMWCIDGPPDSMLVGDGYFQKDGKILILWEVFREHPSGDGSLIVYRTVGLYELKDGAMIGQRGADEKTVYANGKLVGPTIGENFKRVK